MIDWILNDTNFVVFFLVTVMILGYGLLFWIAYQDYKEWKGINHE